MLIIKTMRIKTRLKNKNSRKFRNMRIITLLHGSAEGTNYSCMKSNRRGMSTHYVEYMR